MLSVVRTLSTIFVLILNLRTLAIAESKGFCPPGPPPAPDLAATKPPSSPGAPTADAPYRTTVLRVVISDTGYVCGAQVVRGVDKQSDLKVTQAVRDWRFQPARKDGRPVPVVMLIEVHWKDGELVQSPVGPESSQANVQSTSK
jgi:hypothetical protein